MGLNTRIQPDRTIFFTGLAYLGLGGVLLGVYTLALQVFWSVMDVFINVLQAEAVGQIMKSATSPAALVTIAASLSVGRFLYSYMQQQQQPMKRQMSSAMKRQISKPMKEICLMSALGGALG